MAVSDRAIISSDRTLLNASSPSWRIWCLRNLACWRNAPWLKDRILVASLLVTGLSLSTFYAREAFLHISFLLWDLRTSTCHSPLDRCGRSSASGLPLGA